MELEWTTSTEKNNDYFEVQHATDANSAFKTVGIVQGNGTTLSPSNYTFRHNNPTKGNNYYRLKQVDLAAKEWHSWVISEAYKGINDTVIDVYPNPNEGQFRISLPTMSTDTEALIRVIDTRGATVMEQEVLLDGGLISSYPVETQGLPKGVYHVSLTLMNNNETYNKNFMIR